MNVDVGDAAVARIAAAIGEPARARMLYGLLDGRARTATELAVLAEVSPSTASAHLHRLKSERLVTVSSQGRHRYYGLQDAGVAALLEALNVVAGSPQPFAPRTPGRLRAARTCYDHIAGTLGVGLHDAFVASRWLSPAPGGDAAYDVTPAGAAAFAALGIDVDGARARRRRFAFPCVDWSERRPHVAGALGSAILQLALDRKWVVRDLDSRALEVTSRGRRDLRARFGLHV